MKKFFALYVVAVLAVAVGVTSAKAGSIAHWTFENDGAIGSTPTTFTDSIQGLVGTTVYSNVVKPLDNVSSSPTNQPTIIGNSISGFGNKAASFDGVDDTIYVQSGSAFGTGAAQNTPPLALTGDFTIELGIRNRVGVTGPHNPGFGVFYGDSTPGLDPYYVFVGSGGGVLFQMYIGGGPGPGGSRSVSAGPGSVELNALTHIAAVFDEDVGGSGTNEMSLYIDQTLVASLNIGTAAPFYEDTQSDFWMGSVHSSGGFFEGDLTDVRISDMALSTEEMLLVPEPGMVAIFGMGLLGLALARRKRA
ncbi:MAG: LamG-like jellyroll fold domain-containing protein [Alphaproteobacteria bacterium]